MHFNAFLLSVLQVRVLNIQYRAFPSPYIPICFIMRQASQSKFTTKLFVPMQGYDFRKIVIFQEILM